MCYQLKQLVIIIKQSEKKSHGLIEIPFKQGDEFLDIAFSTVKLIAVQYVRITNFIHNTCVK